MPFQISLTTRNNGASHAGCTTTTLSCGVNFWARGLRVIHRLRSAFPELDALPRFPTFSALMQLNYPAGTASGLTTDNPFPLSVQYTGVFRQGSRAEWVESRLTWTQLRQ